MAGDRPCPKARQHRSTEDQTNRDSPTCLALGAGYSSVDATSRAILAEVGLPDSVVPFLSFRSGPGMLHAARHRDAVGDDVIGFVEIGFDGAGNPIAIDPSDGTVWLFDLDQAFDRTFMNSSVALLAEALVAFSSWSGMSAEELTVMLGAVEAGAVAEGVFRPSAIAQVTS